MSFYLGPERSRLVVGSWAELVAASQAGVFEESAWFEAKAAVPAASKPANLELARDLASLSVDGGTLAIGLADKSHEVVGTSDDFESLRTRIVQVAASRVQPPLHVGVQQVVSPDDASLSVVLVGVPASGSAPHMVDDRYWGRTSEGKRALADSEVARLLLERRVRAQLTVADVDAMADRLDPFRADGVTAGHGHSHVLLRPRGQVGGSVSEVLGGTHLAQVVGRAVASRAIWPPFREGFHASRPLSDGTLLLFDERDGAYLDLEPYLYRLLVRDDGGLDFVAGCGTRALDPRADPVVEVVSSGQQLEMLHGLVVVAAALASDLGFWGEWDLAFRLDGLRGVEPIEVHLGEGSGRRDGSLDDEFVSVAVTTTQEMVDQPAQVVQRVLGPLLRVLGTERRYLPYSTMDEIGSRRTRE